MCSGRELELPSEMNEALYFGVTPLGWNHQPASSWSVISSPTAW